MHLFQSLTKILQEKAKGWQARFPNHVLATSLMIFLVVGVAFIPAINKAHASPTVTNKIQLSRVDMITNQHGWGFNENSKHIFTTNRGPEHWVDVTPVLLTASPNTVVTRLYFPSATRGYIGILQITGAALLSTHDSGLTWQTTPFAFPGTDPNEVAITQIVFLDTQHGWISFLRDQRQPGQFDILMTSTTDGGKTWQTVLDTFLNPASLRVPFSVSSHFTFTSPQDGWVTGIWPAGDVYLYATHDGGKNWSKSSITPMKGSNDVNTTQDYGPYWQNSQNGTLFVRYLNDQVHLTSYRTLDGGKTWILGPASPTTSFQGEQLLSSVNGQEGWGFGFDGLGQYTMNHANKSGLTWDVFHPTGLIQANSDTQVLLSLTFITNTVGWLVIKDEAGNDNLFQTNTGGHSWRALQPVTD